MPDKAAEPKLKFYNTLTRAKEAFEPIDAQNVRMYVCGPTVYDFAHIGNARPAIVFDVLFRLLRHAYGAEHVTYVRNITDVDDKINARALRDHPDLPLNEAIARVTEKTAGQYFRDVAALGCLEPSAQPRATAHIDGMITMIQTLIDKGNAYIAQGSEGREALFDVLSMPSYGKLSSRKLEDQQAGARVAVEPHKRNPADFVLWKESASGEPGWPATFEISDENRDALRLNTNSVSIHGRPGWHIECSVMSAVNLGETFDIHGGGLDLIFPHHENEIAQSVCAHGSRTMANYWMHNGFLQVEGRKMSKSEGNFVTIAELLETEKFGGRKWPGEVLRLAMLMTHYREPIDFSVKRLEEAENILVHWSFIYDDLVEPLNFRSLPQTSAPLDTEFELNILDDLNSPAAIGRLQNLGQAARKDPEKLPAFLKAMDVLGLKPLKPALLAMDAEERRALHSRVSSIVDRRLDFIREKNWAEADRIRDDLLEQGIQLKDGKNPETGERVTTWEVKR